MTVLTKPDSCSLCPLYTKGNGWVPDALVPNPEYVFVGEAPGGTEVAKGEPFCGPAGFVLFDWLMKAVPSLRLAYERGKISITNTLRCLPPEIKGRAYPRGQEKLDAERCCRQYDNWGQAHTIVLLGESAQRAWFGNELDAEDASDRRLGHDVKGVSGRIGREIVKDGRRYVFAPHPAWILRQPAIVEHGQRALSIASNTDRIVEVDYVMWDRALELLNDQAEEGHRAID